MRIVVILTEKKLRAAQERFEREGVSVSDWAKAQGFPLGSVYAVLNGRSRARRGQSHQIAVALGLKSKPENEHLLPSNPTNQKEFAK